MKRHIQALFIASLSFFFNIKINITRGKTLTNITPKRKIITRILKYYYDVRYNANNEMYLLSKRHNNQDMLKIKRSV